MAPEPSTEPLLSLLRPAYTAQEPCFRHQSTVGSCSRPTHSSWEFRYRKKEPKLPTAPCRGLQIPLLGQCMPPGTSYTSPTEENHFSTLLRLSPLPNMLNNSTEKNKNNSQNKREILT